MERLYYVEDYDWKANAYFYYDNDNITEYANIAWCYLFKKEDIRNNIRNGNIYYYADGCDNDLITKDDLEEYDFMIEEDDLIKLNHNDLITNHYDDDYVNDFMLKKGLKNDNELAEYIINFLEQNAIKINGKTWENQYIEYEWNLDIPVFSDTIDFCGELACKNTNKEFETLDYLYSRTNSVYGYEILKSEKGNYFYRYYSNCESDARSYLNGAYIQINKENLNKVLNELGWNDSYKELSEDELEVKKELIENIK